MLKIKTLGCYLWIIRLRPASHFAFFHVFAQKKPGQNCTKWSTFERKNNPAQFLSRPSTLLPAVNAAKSSRPLTGKKGKRKKKWGSEREEEQSSQLISRIYLLTRVSPLFFRSDLATREQVSWFTYCYAFSEVQLYRAKWWNCAKVMPSIVILSNGMLLLKHSRFV